MTATLCERPTGKTRVAEFVNEPLTDFSSAASQKAMADALKKVKAQFGRQYPLIIGGEKLETGTWLESTNPACPEEVIGRFAKASREHADRALLAAEKAFAAWRRVPPATRAQYLFKIADIMRRRKHELSAWMIYEIGKSWAEADGDTAEAIDFCQYYGHEMLRLAGEHPLTRFAHEKNRLRYIPLGVGLIIPPWNFPLAILAGLTAAAVVSGNTVLLKPSSDTPGIAYQFAMVLEEAGLPPGVVNLIPGPGESVGDYLVGHPRIRFIGFTGSKEVGLHINELAARTAPGQIWIKRVIAEMGGKDAIIVDEDANLDVAAEGIVAAAFGFQGQKCSACSRAIIHKKVYDRVLEKIVEKTGKLAIGPTADASHNVGPVASRAAFASIMEYIAIGKKEGRLLAGGNAPETPGKGFFIEPTIIADVDPNARIAQEEIFGPVLSVIKADSWEHALEIANNTQFGLTGAAYSNNRAHLDRADEDFHCGNLYLNRKCTGAMVGVHPFGGFNMSGTDSKAGGPDYLLLFTQAKVVSERV